VVFVQQQWDAIIVGGGHNGLVCGGYLAKAGLKTLVLEMRDIAGGGATTEEIPSLPDFKFNLCSVDHVFIHYNPVIKDLQLKKFGLEYLRPDPVCFIPYRDGKYLYFWKDQNKTAKEIEKIAGARDAKAYLEFVDFAKKVWEMILPGMLSPPPSMADMVAMLPKGPEREEFIRIMLMNVVQLVDEWFDSEYVKAFIARWGPEIGVHPRESGSAIATVLAFATIFDVARPRGGSGMLSIALRKAFEHYGGVVRTNAKVEKIIVKDGKAVGVRLITGEEIFGKCIITNVSPTTVFTQLIEPEYVDPKLRRRIEKLQTGWESAFKANVAVDGLLRFSLKYPGVDDLKANQASFPTAESVDEIIKTWDDVRALRIPPKDPYLYLCNPSALDPTLAPSGKSAIYVYHFAPYELANGKRWEEIKYEVAWRAIDKLAQYVPNIKEKIIGMYVESPVDIERRTGMPKGGFNHINLSLAQMFSNRPLPELSQYRTPIQNLYLTGAGTHPGGSIGGFPGHNTAHVVLEDWKAGKIK
jgi:beta-carotene ketolase (CrtO type)